MATTNLSAGLLIYEILSESPDVTAITDSIFPVISTDANLPFVSFQRTSLMATTVKSGNAADTAVVEVTAWGADYPQAVTLAEAVRAALDNIRAEGHGLTMRCCSLTDSDEGYASDAYYVRLIFTIKIN